MTRTQLEHIVRAAGAITDEPVILVLGSQSILGAFPSVPPPLDVSREADVCPMNAPEKADLISGAIGEVSQFDSTFGYYAHGLSPESCPLPAGWKERLISFQNENTRGVTALCLHPIDLACSKLVAGREKDVGFVAAMLTHRLIERTELEAHLKLLPTPGQHERALRSLEVVTSKVASD
jgi:hypothetical protein